MKSDKERQELMTSLKRKIEAAVLTICIIIIVICAIYAYIVNPVKAEVKSTLNVAYKPFVIPLSDTTGTVEYEERIVSVTTDEDNVTHVKVERIK